jgi:hypothetical protein
MMKRKLHSGGLLPPSFGPIRSHCGLKFDSMDHFAVIGKRGNVNCKNCLRATAKKRAFWTRQIKMKGSA